MIKNKIHHLQTHPKNMKQQFYRFTCFSSLTSKVAILFLVPLCLSAGIIFIFLDFIVRTESSSAIVNISGRQRMFSVQIGFYAHMISMGQDKFKKQLHQTIDKFEKSLTVIIEGGTIKNNAIPRAPDCMSEELSLVHEKWVNLKQKLGTIATVSCDKKEFILVYGEIDPLIEDIRLSSDVITSKFEQWNYKSREKILWLLIFGACINLILFFFALWFVRRSIIFPILALDKAAHRVAAGDFSMKIDVDTHDELSTLADSYNEMSIKIKKLLESIKLQRKHSEILNESLPIGALVLNKELIILKSNRELRKMFDIDDSMFLGHPITTQLPLENLLPLLNETIETQERKQAISFEILDKNGVTRQLEITVLTTHFREEEQVHLLVLIEDCSERELLRTIAEQAEYDALLRAKALDAAADSVIITDPKGQIIYVNRTFVKLHGYELQEVKGQSIELLKSKQTPKAAYREIRDCITSESMWAGELSNRRKSGTIYPAEVCIAPVLDKKGQLTHFIWTQRDITERKKLTEKMLQMDRIIAIGTLAAGIGHEINNPLTYVIGNIDYLKEICSEQLKSHQQLYKDRKKLNIQISISQSKKMMESLECASEGANRVRNIVQDLKIFSRVQTLEDKRTIIDVQRVIESSINMVWGEIRTRAQLIKEYEKIPCVKVDEGRLSQVFVNLLTNAIHAIPRGDAELNTIYLRTRSLDGLVFIEIEDTGDGISPENIDKLFDPFFTTKPIGEGTGLGLAICHQILEMQGGELSVKSKLGEGTIFTVTLPATQSKEALVESEIGPFKLNSCGGRILIVDDEPMIGDILHRVLDKEYDVVAITDAKEALERIYTNEHFDLIFCDIMMPEISGIELYHKLLEYDPVQAQVVVFLSGGIFDQEIQKSLDFIEAKCIEKPFNINELRAFITDFFNG